MPTTPSANTLFYGDSMIFVRPCFARRSGLREGGKPVPTPDRVRGRLFRDHALERFSIGRNQRRHCEERSDEAIQNGAAALDCFAEPVIGPATSGRTRWLAMTGQFDRNLL